MDHQPQTKAYFFETETKRLKQYYTKAFPQLTNKRIIFNNSIGTVRYVGELQHQGRPANSAGELWIGLQWDQNERGKHHGTVNGFEYFKTQDKKGSLVKFEKIQFGYKLQTALFKRYFRAQELHHAKDIYESLKLYKAELENENENEEEKTKKCEQLMKKKVHKTQYDAEAYVATLKKDKKIMVQFIGFDQIWTKINNLQKIQSISLAECRICDLGPKGHLSSLLSNLKILSLEDNLISDWNQVFQLGLQLRQLSQLSLTNNKISSFQHNIEDMKSLQVVGHQQQYDLLNRVIFPNLKCLILINTNLKWKGFFRVMHAFKNIEELILCKNDLTDLENINEEKINELKDLNFLNLQETNQSNFEAVKKFKDLPHLEKIIVNRNKISQLTDITGFKAMKHLSIQFCEIKMAVVIYQISKFSQLQSLNIKHNPVGDILGNAHVRMRSIAEITKLKIINGSMLRKYDRKDSQIYYLRETFKEYFTLKNVPDYDYDYNDFISYCSVHHPNIELLIKKYGNPYEVEEKKEIKQIIKEEVKQNELKKGTGMVVVQISNKQMGTKLQKRIPLSWTLSSLKNFFSKTMKIPVDQQKITCILENQGPQEQMGEDHKTLGYYNLKDNCEITVYRQL